VTPGAFQATNHSVNSSSNAFMAKVDLNANMPAPTITPGGIVPVDSTVGTIQPGEWVSIYGHESRQDDGNLERGFPRRHRDDRRESRLSLVCQPRADQLAGADDAARGPVQVAVTTPGGTATATVTLGQFAPSFLLFDSKHVAGIILRSNGSGAYGGGAYDILGPTGTSLGYSTVAAKAGDIVELFGTGFGPTNPTVEAGEVFSGAAATTNAVRFLINNVSVTPMWVGLSGAGLDQINLTVPAGLGTGDVSLVATVGGAQTPPYVVISLQ